MTQYYSRNDTAYSGSAIFSVPFDYIDKNDIVVKIIRNRQEIDGEFTWLNSSQITVTTTLQSGDIVSVRRETPIDEKIVTYSNESMILDEDNLNLSQDQVLNSVQEVHDALDAHKTDVEYLTPSILDIKDHITQITTVNDHISNVDTVAGDVTNIDTVAGSIDNVNSVGESIENVNTLVSSLEDVTTVAESISDINTVADDISSVTAVANSIDNIDNVLEDLTNIDAVAADLENIDDVAESIANVNTVAGSLDDIEAVKNDLTNIDTVAGSISNVNSVADSISNVNSVAGDLTNINAVEADLTNIDAVAGDLTNIDAVKNNATNINTVATNISNVNSVGGSISNVNSVAGDLTNINAVAGDLTNIDNASSYADLAKDWANKTSGSVDGSEFSAKYYAQQASQSQVQSNWTETDETSKAFIQNKPTNLLTNKATGSGSLTVLGTGNSKSNSINIGSSSTVTGNQAVVIGNGAGASGVKATAIGYYASANAAYAIQLGQGTNGTANTLSIGFPNYDGNNTSANYRLLDGTTGLIPDDRIPSYYIKNIANGTGSLTILGTAANGNYAVNIGNGSYTAGYAVAIGNSASSNGGYSVGIGSGANPYGLSSVAVGRGATTNSSAENAVALGRQATSNAKGAIQIGKGTNTTANTMAVGFADIDGEGTGATYPLLDGTTGLIPDARISTSFVKTSNIDQTYDGTSANAQSGVAIAGAGFIANTATGTSALTINGTATAKTQAINIGTLSQATANYGTTVGAYSYANGSKSSAFGNYARATADRAIQIGQGTNSTADTLQIGFDGTSYQLLDGTTGLIPDARISSNFISINNIDDSLKGTLSHTSPVQIVNLGSNSWQNIIYGANEYVAIGQTGYVSTSSDGTNWTVASSILGNNDWGGGIAYNSNYFVALSADSYISHSNDGVNWDTPYIDTNLSTAQNWHSLVYDGTKFVAMSNAGYVSTSTDGYTWTQAAVVSNLNNSRGLYMGYGNGKFIAIDQDGKIATSNDGTNWTIPTSTNLFASYADSIVYCSGRFVVLSEYGEIYTSFDGENWIYATDLPYSSTYGHWRSLAVNSNQILAISEKGYIASVQISSQLSPSFPYIINSGVIGNTYFREWSDGTLEQWNYRKSSSTAGTQSITYPISFTSEPMLITTYTLAASATTSTTTRNYGYNTSKTGFDVYLAANGRLAWYARGY